MITRYPSLVSLVLVLAIVCSMVAIVTVPVSAQDGYGFELSTYCATVGASVTVMAGFPPSTILTAELDGVAMTTAPPVVQTDDETGLVTFAVKIPATTAGIHIFTVSDGVNTEEAEFQVSPKIVVKDPAAKKGAPGSSVTVVGTGFSAGVTADVYMGYVFDGLEVPVASDVPINSSGGFTVVGTVPNVDSGTYDVWAEDGAGHESWMDGECGVYDTFTVLPTLTITPPSGLAGTDARLYGTGWCAGGNVDILIAGYLYYTRTVDEESILDEVIEIPTELTPGIKEIKVTCQGDAAITQTVKFTVLGLGPTLTISPTIGPKGTTFILSGSHFTLGSKVKISVKNEIYGTNIIAAKKVSSEGSISLNYSVKKPPFAMGANTIIATDEYGKTATVYFNLIPK
jgi:hypothetical protein